jgi:hypothetical protein
VVVEVVAIQVRFTAAKMAVLAVAVIIPMRQQMEQEIPLSQAQAKEIMAVLAVLVMIQAAAEVVQLRRVLLARRLAVMVGRVLHHHLAAHQ